MPNTNMIPKNLTQLNKQLGTALKNTFNEFNIGAFSGVRRFEPLEILHALDSFSSILKPDVFEYITNAVSDALNTVIVTRVQTKLRSGSASTDPIMRYATTYRIMNYLGGRIIRVPIIETEGENAVLRTILIRDYMLFNMNIVNDNGVIDIPSLDEKDQAIVKGVVFRCDTITMTDLDAIVEAEARRVANLITKAVVSGSGQRLGTKKYDASDVMFECFATYINQDTELLTMQRVNTEAETETLVKLFSKDLATCLAHIATMNGIKMDVAINGIEKIKYRLAWSIDGHKNPAFTVIISAGMMSFVKTYKANDIIALKNDIVSKPNSRSAGTERMLRMLTDAGAMYTTALLADSLPEVDMTKAAVDEPVEDETDSE